jgi:hypothetical protein
MFRPRNQIGGDYISSIYLNQRYISSSNITYSSLLLLLSAAHVSSFPDITSLTQAQLADLAVTLQQIINTDNAQITINNMSISQLLHLLNDPGGLNDQKAAAQSQFNIENEAWQSTSTSVAIYNAGIYQKREYYSTLYLSSLGIESTISNLQSQYSSALYEQSTNTSLLDEYNRLYDLDMAAYISNLAVYNSTNSSIAGIISEMSYYSSLLINANSEYYSTSTAYGRMMSDYIIYSTSLINANSTLISTQGYYSSLVLQRKDLESTILGTYGQSTIAGLNVRTAIIKKEYQDAINYENDIIIKLGNARLSTIFYYNALKLDPYNSTLQILILTANALTSSFSTAYQSTHKQRLLLESSQQTMYSTIMLAQLAEIDRLIGVANLDVTNDILEQNTIQSRIDDLSKLLQQSSYDEKRLLDSISDISAKYIKEDTSQMTLNERRIYYSNLTSTLSSSLRSTLQNIQIQAQISTQYSKDYTAYLSNLQYYSSNEREVKSTIDGYTSEISSILNEISSIDRAYNISSNIVSSIYATFYTDSIKYYDYLVQDIDATMQQYIYNMKMYDLRARQATADLTIKRTDNINLMNLAWVQSQNLNISPDTLNTLATTRTDILTTNISIDSLIINNLNPLERLFYDLLNKANNESTMKGEFIKQRKDIFIKYEYPCLIKQIVPSTSISSVYFSDLSDLNTLITSINSQIGSKNAKHDNINAILTANNIGTISGILGKNWFSDVNRTITTPALLLEPTSGSVTGQFGVLKPIIF